MILPRTGSLAIPTQSLQDAVLPGRAQASQCPRAGRPGPGAPVLSCLWQERHCLWWPMPFLLPSVLSLPVDSRSHTHPLPNKGPLLAGDYRWGCRQAWDPGEQT